MSVSLSKSTKSIISIVAFLSFSVSFSPQPDAVAQTNSPVKQNYILAENPAGRIVETGMAKSFQDEDGNSHEQLPSAEQLFAEFSQSWDESKWEKEFRGNRYMRATGEQGWKTRARVMKQLVAGGEASIPAIEKHLTDKNTETRILAAQAISYLAPYANIEKLTDVFKNDADSAVRLYIVDAIGMSGKGQDVDWEGVAKNEKNRDVLKHINYAKSRKTTGVEGSVVTTLVQMPSEEIDSAKVGEQAPDFKLKSVDGTEFSLTQYKGKQPVVLLFIYGDT